MKIKKVLTIFLGILIIIVNSGVYCIANEFEDAEKLYAKINEFLNNHSDVEPENFDEFCKKFMLISSFNPSKNKSLSEDVIILYRGVSDKEFAKEFKSGNIFIASGIRNVRGCGIYTTPDLNLAKSYTDKNFPECIIQIAISKNKTKILENDYLERLKSIIIEKYPNEFGEFKSKTKDDYIFDSMKDYLDEQTKLIIEECMKIEDPEAQNKLFEEKCAKLNEDPTCKKLQAQRKKYFTTNKSAVFYNSGLLTKLLGFDVLHTYDFLSDFIHSKQDEYLIVNTSVINII